MTRGRPVVRVLLAVVAMVAVIIVSLYVYLLPKLRSAGTATPQQNASTIRDAVEMWRYEHHTNACPALQDLFDGKELDRDAVAVDSRGRPFEIRCADGGVVVFSAGPDGKPGTADDIRAE